MELMRKYWPLSFKVVKGSYKSFYINFFIYVIVCFVLKYVAQFAAPIQILGTILYGIYLVVDVYSVVGVVLCVCQMFGVFKQS